MIETYIDECPTFATTGVCQCGTCENSSFTNLRPYHHTNIKNILTRLSEQEPPVDAVVLYIGHTACGVESGVHNSHPYNGLAYHNIGTSKVGVTGINNFSGQVDCTRTLVHEIGHLYGIPEHYGGSQESSEGINNNGQYDVIFYRDCIYGEGRFSVTESLTLCDGCESVLCNNLGKFD